MDKANPLKDVKALTFDVFGTVIDWHGSIIKAMKKRAQSSPGLGSLSDEDWSEFAYAWRIGFWEILKTAIATGERSLDVDAVHRRILDEVLSTERWSALAAAWGGEERDEITMIWHELDGWPDSSDGLASLRKKFIVATLMNGNMRTMIDLSRHADLSWDTILSAELFGALKPDPAAYLGALNQLRVKPEQCAMVAAHMYDLEAAAKQGMRTVYVRRPTEDTDKVRDTDCFKMWDEGKIDLVVTDLIELAVILTWVEKQE